MKNQPNKIRTTKYTILSFIPLNIYHQFTKLNNVFFLATLIMLCIPSVSPFTPFTYLIAFSLILFVSMCKDAVEDIKRNHVDNTVNKRKCFRINQKIFGFKDKECFVLEDFEKKFTDLYSVIFSLENRKALFTKKSDANLIPDKENLNSSFQKYSHINRNKSDFSDEKESENSFNIENLSEKRFCDLIRFFYISSKSEETSTNESYKANSFSKDAEKIMEYDSSNSFSENKIKKTQEIFENNQDDSLKNLEFDYNAFQRCLENYFIQKNIEINECSVENLDKSDFVIVKDNEEVPADILLISAFSSNFKANDHCFVETSGLDGETNLKRKNIPKFFENFIGSTDLSAVSTKNEKYTNHELKEINSHSFSNASHGSESCGLLEKKHSFLVNNNIYEQRSFINNSRSRNSLETKRSIENDRLSFDDIFNLVCNNIRQKNSSAENKGTSELLYKLCFLRTACSLKSYSIVISGRDLNDIKLKLKSTMGTFIYSHPQILLKGSIVKKSYVLGLIVSVGNETKQCKNLNVKELTNSRFERKINRNLKFCFLFYFIILSITGILSSTFLRRKLPYLYVSENKGTNALESIATNYILFSFLVPISLFVTMEISRVFMAIFINKDRKFCDINENDELSSSQESEEKTHHSITYSIRNISKMAYFQDNLDFQENNSIQIHEKINSSDKTLLDRKNRAESIKFNNRDSIMTQRDKKEVDTPQNIILKENKENLMSVKNRTSFQISKEIFEKNSEASRYHDNTKNAFQTSFKNEFDENKNNFVSDDVINKNLKKTYTDRSRNMLSQKTDLYENTKCLKNESILVKSLEKESDDECNPFSKKYLTKNSHLNGKNLQKNKNNASLTANELGKPPNNIKEISNTHQRESSMETKKFEFNDYKPISSNEEEKSFEKSNNSINLSPGSASLNNTGQSSFSEMCICRNSNVLEDLGCVEYLLTDKTGTLTQNLMNLVCLKIQDTIYTLIKLENFINSLDKFEIKNNIISNIYKQKSVSKNFNANVPDLLLKDHIVLFFMALLCCNSIEIYKGTYEGQSQDEICILEGLKNFIKITTRSDDKIHVRIFEDLYTIKIVMVLDFSSKRSRMSVIANVNNRLFLFTKGSDDVMKTKIVKGSDYINNQPEYNKYRSLVVAMKEIPNPDVLYTQNKNSFITMTSNSNKNTNDFNEKTFQKKIILDSSHGKTPLSPEIFNKNSEKTIENKTDKISYSQNKFYEFYHHDSSNYENIQNKNIRNNKDDYYVRRISKNINSPIGPYSSISKQNPHSSMNNSLESTLMNKQEIRLVRNLFYNYDKADLKVQENVLDDIFDTLETNMIYLGTTYIEDKIQKGVKECIRDLLCAGINIWMITGDKKESAISCAYQCGLHYKSKCQKNKHEKDTLSCSQISEKSNFNFCNSNEYVVKNSQKEKKNNLSGSRIIKHTNNSNFIDTNGSENINPMHQSPKYNSLVSKTHKNSSSIINDYTNHDNEKSVEKSCFSLSAENAIEKLHACYTFPQTVIVYRASPEQKAKIASLLSHVVSIGDGNNDIMMLQESDVGIGIRGKEGTQASLSADISAPSFLALRRLILVHGHYNYSRISKVALNSLYKNLLLIFVQFYYNFLNGYSGRPVFNFFFLNYFNVLFTSSIPLYIVIFDKVKQENELLENPNLYKESRKYFGTEIVAYNMVLAIFKASFLFWITYFMFRNTDFSDHNGKLGGYSALNNWFSLIVFLTVIFRQIRMINFFNIFAFIVIITSVALYFFTVFVIQEFSIETRNSAFHAYGMPIFYFGLLVVFGIIFFVDFLYDVLHPLILKKNKDPK